MFDGIETYTILSGNMHNVPCCMYFIMTSDPRKIEWFLDMWQGRTILSVIPWTENNQFDWALHLDLSPLQKFGEEAILPFPWAEEYTPSLDEGIFAWRLFVNEDGL